MSDLEDYYSPGELHEMETGECYTCGLKLPKCACYYEDEPLPEDPPIKEK